MTVLRIILGILMVCGASSVLTIPAVYSVAICWMISFFMLINGIIAIVSYIENKNAEKVLDRNGVPHLKTGIGSLLFGIASVVVSILARSSVIGEVLFMQIISSLYGLWIMLSGVSMVVGGINIKKLALPGWLGAIVLGIMMALAGAFCIVDCFAGLTAVGTMFGISMMMDGFALIFG